MRSRLTTWIRDRPRAELLAHAGLMVVALVLRLIDLGDRPFHHDESQDAYFSWVVFERGVDEHEYNPLLHGPLRFFMTAAVYALFGDSDMTARLAPALMGTLIVGLPYLLRDQIGRIAAFVTALLLTIGPTFLYYSRFAREDIYFACITMGMLVAVFRYLERPRAGGPVIIAVLLALSFAMKESTFITVFVFGTFVIPYVLWQWRRAGSFKDAPFIAAIRKVGWIPWVYAFSVFWLVFAVLFTSFFTNPGGLWDGIWEGQDYWRGQQAVGRGGEPWYFYFVVLFGHEWPALLLGAVGIVACLRRRTTLDLFLVWMFAMSLAVYSWASEKFAWLAMHPLMPLLLLAGIGAQALWTQRRRALRVAGIAVVAVGVAHAVYASYRVNAQHRADPREFLVTTQSSEDVLGVRDRVYSLNRRVRRTTGRPITIAVDSAQGATFPWAWYFRELPVGYVDMTQPSYVPQSQVLIMTEASQQRLVPDLPAFDGERFRFRVWWVRDWSKKFDPAAWADWFVERETWNDVGGMPEWLYVRRDAEAS